ncbi:MAG TPA: exodeoxyribonuclease VII small subunit [Clostridiales bacterium]|jgi:exodeoxyribonuclease VII small subunit|nr:exodeoxyribonuclease VII small subunit [Clostridiales bacterium]HCG35548.1 exodeoxyribonuclease VII small subunit [Clostridiales bacterium]
MEEKKLCFEEALARLDEIVKGLEEQKTPLDVSLSLFEEGVGLVKLCTRLLDEAEQKVKILTRGEDGQVTEASFVGEMS